MGNFYCNNSNVRIPKEYVTGAFFVFLYVDTGGSEPHIFCFSAEEIIRFWELKTDPKLQKQIYYLGISKGSFLNSNKESNFLGFSFTNDRIDQIKEIIKKSVSKNEIELFKLIKQQQNLIEKKDEINQLEKLINEYKHAEELLKENNKILAILKEQYTIELSKIGSDLPGILIEKISKLLKENIPVVNIITQVRDNIPDDIPESVLEEYISQIMIRG